MPTDTVSNTTQSNVVSLFESPEQNLSTTEPQGSAVVFSRGIAPKKNFHVATSDPEFASILEENGGRYIKKYQAFRFKKDMERKIRSLAAFNIETRADNPLHLDDQIRVDAKLEIGATYRDELEGSDWILKEFDPNIEERSLRVKFQKYSPEHDHLLQTFKSIGLSHIPFSMEINPTNADELYHEYVGSKYKNSTDFTSREELRDFLTNGGVVQFGEEEFYVLYMPGPGTNAVATRPVGKPREAKRFLPKGPSVWTASEAVDELLNGHLPADYLKDLPGEERNTPIPLQEDTWFPLTDGHPEQTLLLRGHVTSLKGKNTVGNYIYERNDGLRYAVTPNLELLVESPSVTESGAFLPPENRDQTFSLRDEMFESFKAENVSSIFRTTKSDPLATDTSIQPPEVGTDTTAIDQSVVHKAIAKRIALLGTSEQDPFTLNRREKDSESAYDDMIHKLAQAGYTIDRAAFDGVVNSVNQKLETTTSRLMLAMQAYHQHLALDKSPASLVMDVRELSVSKARQAPTYWLRESLGNLNKRGLDASWSLLVAKAYGTADEISQAERLQSEADEAVISAFREDLHNRYQRIRNLTEIPDTIDLLERKIQADSQTSPIPRESWGNEIRELHKELARSQFDIDSIDVNDEDIHAYRTLGSHSEIVSVLAARHGISHAAAGLYADRVSAEQSQRLQREFLISPEYLVGARAADMIHKAIGTDRSVEIGSEFNSPAIRIPWGAGAISLSRPDSIDGGSHYSVSVRHEAGHGNDQYSSVSLRRFDTMPSAEELSRFLIAFSATCDTKFDYWKAINMENRFGEQGSEKYNCTAIAKSIRAEIKKAKKDRVIPKDIKVSVRKDGHNSINLAITAIPENFKLYTQDYIDWHKRGERHGYDHDCRPTKFTFEGNSLLRALDAIREAWNFDKSDSMTDYFHVNYYGDTEIASELEVEIFSKDSPASESQTESEISNHHQSLPTEYRRMLIEFEEAGSCHNEKLGLWAGITRQDDEYTISIDQNGKANSLDISEAMNVNSGDMICIETCSRILARHFERALGFDNDSTKEIAGQTISATPGPKSESSTSAKPPEREIVTRRPADYSKLANVLTDRQSRIVGEIIKISERETDITATLYVEKNDQSGDHNVYGYKSVCHNKRLWFSVDPLGRFSRLDDDISQAIESKMENNSPIYVKSNWNQEFETNGRPPALGM